MAWNNPNVLSYSSGVQKSEIRFTRLKKGFLGSSDGKESTCIAGDLGSIPGLGRYPGEGIGYSLQYSCLQNPMSREAWQATVHGVTEAVTTEQLTLSLQAKERCGWNWLFPEALRRESDFLLLSAASGCLLSLACHSFLQFQILFSQPLFLLYHLLSDFLLASCKKLCDDIRPSWIIQDVLPSLSLNLITLAKPLCHIK